MSDSQQEEVAPAEIAALTAEIVGAYVCHHMVSPTDLPALIVAVGNELGGLGLLPAEQEEEKPIPTVPINRSVRPEAIICLSCGKKQKLLKRHLETQHGLDPNAYRAMYDLKADYPLVAPDYAAKRSALAKMNGLGRKPLPEKPAKAPRKKATRRQAPKKR